MTKRIGTKVKGKTVNINEVRRILMSNTKPQVKVGDVVSFFYEGGSKPGQLRFLHVAEYQPVGLYNQRGYIKGMEIDDKVYRNFKLKDASDIQIHEVVKLKKAGKITESAIRKIYPDPNVKFWLDSKTQEWMVVLPVQRIEVINYGTFDLRIKLSGKDYRYSGYNGNVNEYVNGCLSCTRTLIDTLKRISELIN